MDAYKNTVCTLIILGVFLSPHTYAQPKNPAPPPVTEASATDKQMARTLMDEGDEAVAANNWLAAEKAFCAADKIMRVSITSLDCGKAFEKQGKLLEAKDAYLRAFRYQFPGDPSLEPKVLKDARAEAEKKSNALDARFAELTLVVLGLDPKLVSLKVDGELVQVDLPRRLVNPGLEHLVSASASGYSEVSVRVTLKEGERKIIELKLEKPKPLPPPSAKSLVQPKPVPEIKDNASQSQIGFNPAAITGFSLGAAGLIAGAVTGSLSLVQTNTLKKDCEDAGGSLAQCPPSVSDAQSRQKEALTLAHISTVTLAVGGASSVFGIIALFTLNPRETKSQDSFIPLFGPGSIGLRGNF